MDAPADFNERNAAEEAAQAAELEAQLSEKERAVLGENARELRHACLRFLRATQTTKKASGRVTAVTRHPDKALARAKEVAAFKLTPAVHTVTTEGCQECRSRPGAHYLHLVGIDSLRRPVAYSVFSRAKSRKVEDSKNHILGVLTDAERLINFMHTTCTYPPYATSNEPDPWGLGRHHERLVWAVDFAGFGLRDCGPQASYMFLEVLGKYFPERLGKILLLCAPRLFSGLWSLIQPAIDPVTREKIVFVPADSDPSSHGACSRAALEDVLGAELGAWLHAEMVDVRRTPPKAYFESDAIYVPPPPLCGSVADAAATTKVGGASHNRLGEAHFLDMLRTWHSHLRGDDGQDPAPDARGLTSA